LEFDINLAKSLGFERNIFEGNTTHFAKHLLIFDKVIDNMYIYSNVVEPIYVGNVKVPLLKSIWIDQECNSYERINITIKQPMYVPVCLSSLNSVEINIRNDAGHFIPFKFGSKTGLVLHFVKINKS
jgi:hypothetical protein